MCITPSGLSIPIRCGASHEHQFVMMLLFVVCSLSGADPCRNLSLWGESDCVYMNWVSVEVDRLRVSVFVFMASRPNSGCVENLYNLEVFLIVECFRRQQNKFLHMKTTETHAQANTDRYLTPKLN